ncbi:autophagy protein 13 [Conoideocrella luteorostrata]|uniref:Autophagy-related protein 13 n=1 Tax=Conoideocrella luteorostrata TaxID=1105319 RepID=A0AAJ0CHB3_9HYPO|nr:autophagy protein 13 [Conoideocrella luteorostrata]
MHQQARPPPRLSASPASSPHIPQSRNNSSRETPLNTRQRAGSNVSGRDPTASPTTESLPTMGPPADSVKKLDQIVQNFFNKTASLILESRTKVTPARNSSGQRKANRWFQIETDEIDDFKDDLKIWKTCTATDNRLPPLTVEVYLDTSSLKESQSLVLLDDDGKRWDVMEQLNSSDSSSSGSYHTAPTSRNGEVVLERWRIDLKTTGSLPLEDFGPTLPTIYKKAVIFFRTLFIAVKVFPAWRFASQGVAKNSQPALIPRCRIRTSEPGPSSTDLLRQPIDGRSDSVTDYVFGDLEIPSGRLSASVTYRSDCSFRIDDSESLLSSRFMGVDEDFFKPSVPQRSACHHGQAAEAGSLREHRRGNSEFHQTYGSLSTFHGDGPLGTSPLSALRAIKTPGSDTSSPPAALPITGGQDIAPSSMPIYGRMSSPRTVVGRSEGAARRPSISFQPFKGGSLSGSPVPRQFEPEPPASAHSQGRPGLSIGSQPRNRSSLTAGMPASLRGGPPSTSVDTPAAGSPRPTSTTRYSSSFTHRRGRLSLGRAGDDEQSSSGRQSLASSVAQPGSGLLAEAGGGSSGSLHAEEDDISDFLKALDSRKTLRSFEQPVNRGESATNRTVAQLSKFHLMRDSNNTLTESMTSSMQMQRSSSSSSRQLTSVPGMEAPASMSASSSPGKPLSPHTPHTPAIPSRLSENSVIDYSATGRITSRGGRQQAPTVPEVSRESTITQEGTTAIDIPLSPRIESYQRRSSSAAQQSRTVIDDEDTDLAFAAHRSTSLGANDGEPPTMSILLGRQMGLEGGSAERGDMTSGLRPAAEIQASDASASDVMQRGSNDDSLPNGLMPSSVGSRSAFPRRRYAGMGTASKATPPQSSRGSFTGSLSRLGRGDDESVGEEPLVFDLSEMDAQSRRSLEEGREGRNTSSEQNAFEPRGTSRRGW